MANDDARAAFRGLVRGILRTLSGGEAPDAFENLRQLFQNGEHFSGQDFHDELHSLEIAICPRAERRDVYGDLIQAALKVAAERMSADGFAGGRQSQAITRMINEVTILADRRASGRGR